MRAEGEWIAVGAVARAHGVRGDMKVVLFNRSSDVLERVDAIGLRKANADEDCDIVAIVRARSAGAQWVITLEGIDDCDAVEPLRGKEI